MDPDQTNKLYPTWPHTMSPQPDLLLPFSDLLNMGKRRGRGVQRTRESFHRGAKAVDGLAAARRQSRAARHHVMQGKELLAS